MKRLILTAGALVLPFLAAASLAADAPALDETGRMSYALGFQLGRDLAGTQVNNDALLKGLGDGRSGAEPKLPPDQMQAAVERIMKCGIGVCDSCALDGKHVCRDGPVFRLDELERFQEALLDALDRNGHRELAAPEFTDRG